MLPKYTAEQPQGKAPKKRIITPETRAKISAMLTGRRGRPHTAEEKAKIGAAHRGRSKSPETIAKLKASKRRNAQLIHLRFWSKVDKSGDCWVWTAGRDKDGYGQFSVDGRSIRAHRFLWQQENGPISDGMEVCHSCDNPPCVNPAHLWLGTGLQNHRDKAAKGRAYRTSLHITPETRAKLSAAKKGKLVSPKEAARLRAMAPHPNQSLGMRAIHRAVALAQKRDECGRFAGKRDI